MTSRVLKEEDREGYVLRAVELKGYDTWINGYVSVPNDSKLRYLSYIRELEGIIEVHGGLTYSQEMEGKWTFGFDTMHLNDDATTQNVEYVWGEVEKLYEQLIAYEEILRNK